MLIHCPLTHGHFCCCSQKRLAANGTHLDSVRYRMMRASLRMERCFTADIVDLSYTFSTTVPPPSFWHLAAYTTQSLQRPRKRLQYAYLHFMYQLLLVCVSYDVHIHGFVQSSVQKYMRSHCCKPIQEPAWHIRSMALTCPSQSASDYQSLPYQAALSCYLLCLAALPAFCDQPRHRPGRQRPPYYTADERT